MGKASSAKKVARLAQKGKGRKVRFQGGTLFPALIVGIAVFGAALIVYSRASIPDQNVPPTVEDHWHASYGFYACDAWLPDLQGNKEEQDSAGQLLSEGFRRTGIHSHDDGVIHWHPYSSEATGRNAKLGVFLDVYGVKRFTVFVGALSDTLFVHSPTLIGWELEFGVIEFDAVDT